MTSPHDATAQEQQVPETGPDGAEAPEGQAPEGQAPEGQAPEGATGAAAPDEDTADQSTGRTGGKHAGEPTEEPGDEVTELQQQLAERTADLQRLQAEFLNYKRRVDRDRDLVRENATFSVLSALLPVLDDIDRAEEHGELTGGFKAVAESLRNVVAGLGLTRYGAKGDEFDPMVHEALMHGHSPDVTTTTVDVVAQPGYRVGERVVRVAKVTVLDPEPGGQPADGAADAASGAESGAEPGAESGVESGADAPDPATQQD